MKSVVRPALGLFAAVVVLCLAGSAVAASPPPKFPTGRSIPTGPVHLTMWWWGQQEAHGAKGWLAQTIKLYEKLHPNITISTVLETTNGLIPSFEAAAAAHKGPDIEYFWGGIYSLDNAWTGAIRPISDYIPKSQWSHYINRQEDTWGGKVWTAGWYVIPAFPVLYRKDVLAKAGVQPPHTWPQLLKACDTLSAQGITPLAGGISDGWFGGWLYSMIGDQNIKSPVTILNAVIGKTKFNDPQLAAWWTRLQETVQHHCWNNDINSLQLYQAQQKWAEGKAAMTITAGSDVKKFVAQVGASKVGVMAMPAWGKGPYAGKLGSSSQTLGITSWTKYPQVAANFIEFMHTPAREAAWYKATGAFPADNRFPGSLVKGSQMKQLYKLVTHGSPYIENYIPFQFDTKANFAESQLVLGGKATGQQAAQASETIAQRIRLTQRSQMTDFAKWAATWGK